MADLVDEAKKAYPACLDQWLNPSGEYLGQAAEEKWATHPDNNKKKGQGPAAAVVRMYTYGVQKPRGVDISPAKELPGW